MIEGIYYFGEQLRWNLSFPQPNAGGAFAAMLVILGWSWVLLPVRSRAAWMLQLLLFIPGALGAYALTMTFSRGALVALVLSLAACGGLILLQNKKAWIPVSVKLIAMLTLLVVLNQWVGMDERMAPEELVSGQSSSARLELWTGGLQMIHLKPFSGWGVGKSGKIYMHWFQRLDGTHKVAGMINSYLHVATERGIPFLMCVLFPALTLMSAGILGYLKRDASQLSRGLCLSSLGVLMVFATANIFSTLWVFKHLWWLPVLASGMLLAEVAFTGRMPSLLRATKLGFGATLTLAASLLAASAVAGHNSPVARIENGFFIIEPPGDPGQSYVVYGDESVLGRDYGQRVRELASDGISIWAATASATRDLPDRNFDRVIYCGDREPDIDLDAHKNSRIVFLNPLFSPPENVESRNITVVLGSLRLRAKQFPWIQSARSNEWDLQIIKGVGQDLRNRWPIAFDPGSLD